MSSRIGPGKRFGRVPHAGSTALRMVAGLEEISSRVLRIGDRTVDNVPSRDGAIAMVFQSHAPYPHLSVHDNISTRR